MTFCEFIDFFNTQNSFDCKSKRTEKERHVRIYSVQGRGSCPHKNLHINLFTWEILKILQLWWLNSLCCPHHSCDRTSMCPLTCSFILLWVSFSKFFAHLSYQSFHLSDCLSSSLFVSFCYSYIIIFLSLKFYIFIVFLTTCYIFLCFIFYSKFI